MTVPKRGGSAGRVAQGLATLALLKVNFDQGHDHIEMFMPFVRDCIGSLSTDEFGYLELGSTISWS